MKIISAEFIISAVKQKQFPEPLPEIAFAGRSNVGKSSLINAVLNRKKLVKISSRPGKTQQINFFKINNCFYFVDLPGYGYAKVSKSLRIKWGKMIENYLANRKNLLAVVLIIDIRRTPQVEELNFILWLKNIGLNSIIILTKADKLSKTDKKKQAKKISDFLNIDLEKLIIFSAKTKEGKPDILKTIENLVFESEKINNA